MAFPHPKARKDHCWHEDKPGRAGVLWNSVKRTVNVTEYRNAKDDAESSEESYVVGDLCLHDQVSFSMATLLPPATTRSRPLINVFQPEFVPL